MQLQAILGLQVDHQAVGHAHGGVENGVRCRAKVHHDAGVTASQAFAGADVKRHTGPAPVGNFRAQGDKGFGVALRADTGLLPIAWHLVAINRAGRVLAPHHVLRQRFLRPGLERTQHFELFVADGIGMRVNGRLHADGAQQLQRVVLHHVAQRAGGLVERTAALHAELFSDGDLDVGNMLAPPQRLKQRIAKAQRKQVLYRWLAQVMVYAKDLFFFKELAYRAVDLAVGGKFVSQWFFQHHARFGGVQPGRCELFTHGGEQRGGGGNVHHHGVGIARLQGGRQLRIVVGLGEVHPHELDQRGKLRKLLGAGPLGQVDVVKPCLHARAILLAAEIIPPYADDATAFGQRAMAKRLKQRRHELAPGEVAGSTKQDKIKAHSF